MSKKRLTPEQQLTALAAEADELFGDDLVARVEHALTSHSNIVVECAAKLVVSREAKVSEKSLLQSWNYFVQNGVETDKNCRAKTPLIEALNFLEFDDPDFYLQGMTYRQSEPAWGGAVETASNVRGGCAFGLIRCQTASPATTMLALVDLLNDSEALARVHAASAIAATGSPVAVPVLRLKVLTADPNFEVIGECFRGLLELDLKTSIPFVSGYLNRNIDLAIEAATALGATRNEAAVRAVIDACAACQPELIEAFCLSLGLSRMPSAIDYLVRQIIDDTPNAMQAVKALAPVRFYAEINESVAAAVDTSGNVRVQHLFAELFA